MNKKAVQCISLNFEILTFIVLFDHLKQSRESRNKIKKKVVIPIELLIPTNNKKYNIGKFVFLLKVYSHIFKVAGRLKLGY